MDVAEKVNEYGIYVFGVVAANRARVCTNPKTQKPTVQVIYEISAISSLIKIVRYYDPETEKEVEINEFEVTKFPQLQILKEVHFRITPKDHMEIIR